jgi:hypothetical protein
MDTVNEVEVNDRELKYRIESIDLEPIIQRMIKIHKWSRKHAIQASHQYKNFLFLKQKYGSQYSLPPSVDIDEFWHNHILHTAKYSSDCEILFGDYLHHHPHHGIDGKLPQETLEYEFERETQFLYEKEFGHCIYEVRPTSLIAKLIEFLKH